MRVCNVLLISSPLHREVCKEEAVWGVVAGHQMQPIPHAVAIDWGTALSARMGGALGRG